MKQTAVEWLVEQILQKVQNYEDGDVETEEDPFIVEYVNRYNFNVDLTKFVEQAKELEKEQKFSMDFIVWYSGMKPHQIENAHKRWIKETFKSE